MSMAGILNWFAGDGNYMTLFHCMGHDKFWVGTTIVLDLLVAVGYVLIARHWWINQRMLPPHSSARRALGGMRNIFIFCGICGYLFIPIKMFWPAWRLYDFVILFLVYFTWRYALNAKNLGVVYSELSKTAQLSIELADSQADVKRKGFFLNAISHDLRTPLNGLMLQVDLAEMSLRDHDQETLEKSLVEIRASARVTADLLNSFLEIGRLDWSREENRLSTFDVAEFLQGVVQVTQAVAECAGLTLRIDSPLATMPVRTDRIKLERVLLNLVGNGVKFTRSGGVTVGATVAGDDVTVTVTDTGAGISQVDQEQLFQEFFQVNNNERDRRKGFGLGLAIARRLAEQLGGSIAVESEVGRGSRFHVRLPGIRVPEIVEPRPRIAAISAAVAG